MTIEDRFRALFGIRRGAGADPRDTTSPSEAGVLYGPNGDAVVRCLARIEHMPVREIKMLGAARSAERSAERSAALTEARTAAMDAARAAEWGATATALRIATGLWRWVR
jgi:hypothetical protein